MKIPNIPALVGQYVTRPYFISKPHIKNNNITLLTNTCIGGVLYHELGLPFLSPTINLYIRPYDFVKFCENLPYYISLTPCEIAHEIYQCPYPVAALDDVIIFCKHYTSFEEFAEAWERRKKRICWDNIYLIMTDRFCCSRQTLDRFLSLGYEHKICFVAPYNYRPEKNIIRIEKKALVA